jgi:hypothetical protein
MNKLICKIFGHKFNETVFLLGADTVRCIRCNAWFDVDKDLWEEPQDENTG